jgi:hypothetical protein
MMSEYKLKHPETKEWVTILAESFHEALGKLKAMVRG